MTLTCRDDCVICSQIISYKVNVCVNQFIFPDNCKDDYFIINLVGILQCSKLIRISFSSELTMVSYCFILISALLCFLN